MDIHGQGRRVIVTAGAAGIGKVIAERFAAHGATVWVNDVDAGACEAMRAANPNIGVGVADVSDEAATNAFFDRALDAMGGLDVLVNNAGVAGPTKKVEEVTLEEWRRTLAINLDGMFLATRRAVPALRKAGGGAIINLSSIAGRLGFPLRSPYSTSKFGVVGFTETLAIELGPDNISVNAILPGVVDGDRARRVVAAKAEALGITPEAFQAKLLRKVSMRTMVQPEEIADMAVYLALGAGRHISGQSLSICGNMETLSDS